MIVYQPKDRAQRNSSKTGGFIETENNNPF